MTPLPDGFKHIYDISVLLGSETINYPGDTPYSRQSIVTVASGGYNLSKMVLNAHNGTHIDIPLHFIPDRKSIDRYPVQDFIFPALVVEISGKTPVQSQELNNLDISPGDALLFKTNNSISGKNRSGKFSRDFVYLTSEAAGYCVKKKAALVGIDYVTIEKSGDESYPVHHTLLEHDIFILEHIDLKEIQPGRYTLFCLPLKIEGGEASPVRAILLK